MMTATRVEQIVPIERAEARALAATEYGRVADQFRSLAPHDWARPTECPLWDVRAMAGHTVGMMGDFTSLGHLLRRLRAVGKAARRDGRPMIDHMTAAQVADLAALPAASLAARVDLLGPKAARWRTRRFTPLRVMTLKEEVGGAPETWKLAYLLDVILTRDPWMHRADIARACGIDMVLTPEHDGRIVADVVAEWARRHGRPFTLTLTGPAGGEFVAGGGGERITMDALEFTRALSGRVAGSGLLSREVPF